MKKLPAPGWMRTTALALAIAIAVVALLSLPWRAAPAPAPPRLESAARGSGPLLAGAGEATFDVAVGDPIAGFAKLRWRSDGIRDPVRARALVLSEPGCRVALVSVELLLVPDALERAVATRIPDLRLDGLVVAATHTHAGPGGYWDREVGERLATGPYDPETLERMADRIADAIRAADAAKVPAELAIGRGRADALVRSRSGTLRDGRLVVVRVAATSGAPIAEAVVFPAHPTILGGRNRRISGDWPGPFMAAGRHGLRLAFQGAVGDQSAALPSATGRWGPEEYARAVSGAVDAVAVGAPDPAPPLAFAVAQVALPRVAPGALPEMLRRAAGTLFGGALPTEARAIALRLGPVTLLGVPGEPTAPVGERWRAAAGAGAEILALAGDYVGYVETPERFEAREGEAKRSYYGPGLEARLASAALAAARALEPAAQAEPVRTAGPAR